MENIWFRGKFIYYRENIINGKKTCRDIYADDNQNSLGILLFQGDNKVFFSGDMIWIILKKI